MFVECMKHKDKKFVNAKKKDIYWNTQSQIQYIKKQKR